MTAQNHPEDAREETEEHRWMGPESNPANEDEDDDASDGRWMGPESNPASGDRTEA